MTKITVRNTVDAPVEKVWKMWTEPEHIVKWNSASEDWHTPKAINDVREGGIFSFRMESRDGKEGFDFGGTYDVVTPHKQISYTMDDGRKAEVDFREEDGKTQVIETFDAETENPVEMQREGWQSILDNFKKHAESFK